MTLQASFIQQAVGSQAHSCDTSCRIVYALYSAAGFNDTVRLRVLATRRLAQLFHVIPSSTCATLVPTEGSAFIGADSPTAVLAVCAMYMRYNAHTCVMQTPCPDQGLERLSALNLTNTAGQNNCKSYPLHIKSFQDWQEAFGVLLANLGIV